MDISEEQSILMLELRNKFYTDLSRLIGESISELPEYLRASQLEQLSDMCSVYGSQYEEFLVPSDMIISLCVSGEGISNNTPSIELEDSFKHDILKAYRDNPNASHDFVLTSLLPKYAHLGFLHGDNVIGAYEVLMNTLRSFNHDVEGIVLDIDFLSELQSRFSTG
jgi:hypothetical protein